MDKFGENGQKWTTAFLKVVTLQTENDGGFSTTDVGAASKMSNTLNFQTL